MKKGLTILLVLILSFSMLLTACGSKNNSNEGSQTTTKPSKDKATNATNTTPGSPIKIEVVKNALGSGSVPKPADDPVIQALNEKLNIDLTVNLLTEYDTQLNVRLAGGNLPDVYELPLNQISDYSERGLLLDLTPYLDQLQQVVDFQTPDNFEKGKIGDKQYAIIRHADIPFSTYMIRQDWLDNLGLQMPTTPEELLSVAKAFTENDPDQNGKNDTIGLTGFGLNTFGPLYPVFGVGSPGDIYVKNGRAMSAALDPDMKSALAFINKMIDSGAVDKEFLVNKNNMHIDKVKQGSAGIVYAAWHQILRDTTFAEIKAINPEAEWSQVPALTGPAGTWNASYDYGKAPSYHVISKSVEKDPEKLQKILDLFSYLATDEGLKLVGFGIEGTHYEIVDGKIKTLPANKDIQHISFYQLSGRDELEYLSSRFAYVEKEFMFAYEQPRLRALNGLIYEYPDGYSIADVERFTEEELVKFMFGEKPLDEFEAFTEMLRKTFNYDAYMELVEKRLKDKGEL
ncbi:extracellular solute-binding protein [Paenibacillus sp. GXUN7292]|uniref:extracellular solute-binding protein n=1 Tax=Paenibacillus sp. GXUN7292 TaxID=3422499 RepID=UPI003D7EA5C3